MKHYTTLFGIALSLLCPALLSAQSSSPILKVDLNTADRTAREVNELGFTAWPIKAGMADTITLKGIKIIFTKKGENGTGLIAGYYKTAVQAPYYARLAGDGLSVKNGSAGAQIEMRIIGLPAGPHTLLTYHNNIEGNKPNVFAPINIYVNGKLQFDKLTPSFRVHENSDSKSAYLKFETQKGKDVVILFEADPTSAATNKNIIINGFELNTPNVIDMARLPHPLNADEHADADNNNLQLSWAAANNAASHDLYFGTDSASVATATHASALFKENLKKTAYAIGKVYSMLSYYWRVDEIDASGKLTKGNVWYFRPRQLAFTDAEGYGRFARGGRGGKVVEVTNLNDDGPGSLREAVTKDIGPRTIVFAVSGIIQLKSRLVLRDKYVTIAGQTAPGKGICISRAPLGIVADDDIIRFMRVRVGTGITYDGMGITGADNSIVDHCSISWSIDEAFSSRGAHNITLQRTLISEALNVAGHDHYAVGKAHGFAASIGGEVGSFHHNLLANCSGRNWSLAGGADGDGNYLGKMDIRNNVVYNWDTRTTDGGAREVNFVGNYYKPGPSTTFMYALNAQHEGYGGGKQQYFFDGNVMPGHFDENNQTAGRKQTGKADYETFLNKEFFIPYVKTQSAVDAYKDILSDVGCNQPVFDDHDIRIINETATGTTTFKGSKSGKAGLIDSQNDAGGWEDYPEVHRPVTFDSDHDGLPDWWESIKQLNIHSAKGDFADATADPDKDGFTNLDDYLEWMAKPHFVTDVNKPVVINLRQFTYGYTDKPVFTTSAVINGKVKMQSNGTAQFVPDKAGLGSFKFTVTDAAGSTFTRQINIATGTDILK
ncbi:T9SS C-terminal target domain-containing protein [Mucilaginibacter sp. HMF5004]|uniref:Ig-like domain-containing protein n=1 Tax=Mucilaginibacter rivuli TaxID=2857527 RepID=UPI001C5F3871|nr:T9SS C-terminal target domain-containing protein [Mucilaginibacter rivuli]MBW4891881.1 T9SS C-terminal target domain-containing protein [Mucilaginibacter rivuli]